MSTVALRIKNSLAEIARVTETIERLAADQRLPMNVVWPLNIAMDEVLSNVIRYAHTDGLEHEIHVRVSVERGGLTAQVEDDGAPFDPLSTPRTNIERRVAEGEVGGLGIHLVRNLMSEVSYARIGGRNRLTLKKSLAPNPEEHRMNLSEVSEHGVRVLEVQGRLDSATAGEFEAKLADTLKRTQQRLLIDLSRLLYISSAGFRVLYRILMQIEQHQGKVVLCGLSAEVRDLFTMTGFNKLFRIADTRDEAIAALE
jgi:serine/threonine-protein kinase RsbW/sigma-B regulation protein RsbU (phosphoserine phosphatase)